MVADFPVPRAQLPRVEVTPLECQARKAQMERMLQQVLDDYDHFRVADKGYVDPARWKRVDAKEGLALFRERQPGSSRTTTTTMTMTSFSASEDDNASLSSQLEDLSLSFDATSAAALSDGRHRTKALMAVGELTGRVENMVYAVVSKNGAEFALTQSYLQDGIADCAILNMMEGPTTENPLHFLGYKWLAKKAPAGTRLIKHRDLVYVESVGMTTTKTGEEIGYMLVESVDLPSFPEFTDRNCVRAVQSLSILVRQKGEKSMDVFITGLVLPSGKMNALTAHIASQVMFSVTKGMEVAECKRLTKMVVHHRYARERMAYRSDKPTNCTLCHQKRKFYNGVSLADCSICGHVTCTRCQTHKRVFLADGILGRFIRVNCCKNCVMAADPTRPSTDRAEPIKLSISAQLQRQNSNREVGSMENYAVPLRLRSSSESSLDGEVHEFDTSRGPTHQSTIDEDKTMGSGALTDRRYSRPQAGPGITLLPSTTSLAPARTHRTANRPTASVSSASLDSSQSAYQMQRHHSSSTTMREPDRYLLNDDATSSSALVIRSSSPPSFSSSAPAGTYDLRAMTPAVRPVPSGSSAVTSQHDLFLRMMELRRLAESTYETTQYNGMIMQQHTQRTPDHTARRQGF